MNTIHKKIFVALMLLIVSCKISAEVTVIVNPDNDSKLDKKYISMLFLGKQKKFSNGKVAIPVDQTAGGGIRVEFLKKVVGKNESQWKSFWSRLIFTGKGIPPQILDSDAEVKKLVARNKDAIGFIDSASVDSTIKPVATF